MDRVRKTRGGGCLNEKGVSSSPLQLARSAPDSRGKRPASAARCQGPLPQPDATLDKVLRSPPRFRRRQVMRTLAEFVQGNEGNRELVVNPTLCSCINRILNMA